MIVYGKQPILYLLEHNFSKIEKLYLAKEIDKRLFSKIKSYGIDVVRVDNKKAQAMAKGGNHQGIIAEIEPIEYNDFKEIRRFNFVVVLCGLTDVGNIGAIARTAYALGVEALVITGVNQIKLEGAVRTSSGALFNLPLFFEKNPLEAVNRLKTNDFYLVGAAMAPKDSDSIKTKEKKALFLGSEDEGIPGRVLSRLDSIMTIEMKNGFDSLNVSAAAAILIDRIV